MLLLPGEVASPHPNDPVELRRLMFQTPGLHLILIKRMSLITYFYLITVHWRHGWRHQTDFTVVQSQHLAALWSYFTSEDICHFTSI